MAFVLSLWEAPRAHWLRWRITKKTAGRINAGAITLKTPIFDLERSLVAWPHLQSALHVIPVLSLCGFLTAPAPVAAVESVTGLDAGGMLAALLIVMLTAVALAALVIIGLVLWSRKQEHIDDMMLFCTDIDFTSCQYHSHLLIYKGNLDSSYKIGQSFLYNWRISRYFYSSDIDPKWARPRFSNLKCPKICLILVKKVEVCCMKYLVHSEDEAERCASARALGRINDPGALLVLVDVIWDEEETEAVRKAASETLHEMSVHFRKRKKIITDLELEAEQRNFRGIIEILTANFEQGKTRYVQSAYIIGRHHMRLERYADAREWLTKAEFRNRKFNLYGNRIGYWIQVCNTRLLEEADDSFKTADYQQAREHYAVLTHGLSNADNQRCAVYLRSACVYCKLKDYRNADQALLQALEHNHETDLALTLVPLLREILSPGDKKIAPKDKLEEIKSAIDERASVIMNALLAQNLSSQTT
jgi:tetratricopeptide (TPR) repeat protein